MPRSDFAFSHRIRVRWSEVDPQGVVFNARYLDYADIAITEYWRAVDFRRARPDEAFEFHVAKALVNYRKPIRPDEEIDLFTRTSHFGTSSLTALVEIHGAGAEDLRAEIELVSVHVDLATHRPKPMPRWLGETFTAFDKRT